MLCLTHNIHDAKLLGMFKARLGNEVTLAKINQDFAWYGVGEGGNVIGITGDRKKTRDLLSCIETGHYLQQLQDAKEAGFDWCFLLWEDEPPMRQGEDGMVQLRTGKGWVTRKPMIAMHRVDSYLDELSWYAGVRVIRAHGVQEAVRRVVHLYLLTQKPPEDHHALEQFFTPSVPGGIALVRPSVFRRMAKELTGVGWDRSKALEELTRGSLRRLAGLSIKELEKAEGVGKKTATIIHKEMGDV